MRYLENCCGVVGCGSHYRGERAGSMHKTIATHILHKHILLLLAHMILVINNLLI
jgi:hypothetical protein